MKKGIDIRPSPIAGKWYPGDPGRLSDYISGVFERIGNIEVDGSIVAVMAPHAGYRYSGEVAGYAFSILQNSNPDIVVVISPMHQPYHQPLLTCAHSAYQTPLGEIPIDVEILAELGEILFDEIGVELTPVRNDKEHSLEIELPFLQFALDGFNLLPLMVREHSRQVIEGLGKALAKVLADRKSILIASTDLSHFYPQNIANQYDSEVLQRVSTLQPQRVLEVESDGKGFACGRAALASVMWAAVDLGANRAQILNYATSGDVTGDYSSVVGYASGVFTKTDDHSSIFNGSSTGTTINE